MIIGEPTLRKISSCRNRTSWNIHLTGIPVILTRDSCYFIRNSSQITGIPVETTGILVEMTRILVEITGVIVEITVFQIETTEIPVK